MGKGVLYNKDGSPIYYNQDDYDPISQTNLPDHIDPPDISYVNKNFFDIGASYISGQTRRLEGFQGYNQPLSTIDEDYDNFSGPVKSWADIEANRVNLQSDWTRAKNTLLGGVTGAIGIALKEAAYMSDPLSFAKMLGWYDGQMINPISIAMENVGGWLEQGSEEWMPIYENPDPNSLTDQLFKWNTASSVLKSTLGFLLPGAAAAKAGKIATKGAILGGKMAKMTGSLIRIPQAERVELGAIRMDAWRRSFPALYPELSKIVGKGGPLLLNTVGEAMYEASDSQDELIRKLGPGLVGGSIGAKEANNMANEVAQNVYMFNILKMGIDARMMGKLQRALDPTKKLRPGFWKEALDQAIEAPKQGLEEGYQKIVQKESIYQSLEQLKKRNKNSEILKTYKRSGEWENPDISTDFWNRIGDYATQDDVILESIIGAISGPIQSFGTQVLDKGPINAFRFRHNVAQANKEFQNLNIFKKKQTRDVKGGTGIMERMISALEKSPQDNLLESKTINDLGNPAISVRLDRAETVSRLTELTRGNKTKEAIVKRSVYNSMILESLAKGSLASLESHAKEVENTEAYAKDLYGYIQENKRKLQRIGNFVNKEEVLFHMNKLETYKATLDALQDDATSITSEDAFVDRETKEVTDIGKMQLKGINKSIAQIKEKINEESDVIEEISSRRHQWRLINASVTKDIQDKALKRLSKIRTNRELKDFLTVYPELKNTSEYTATLSKIQDGKPISLAKKFSVRGALDRRRKKADENYLTSSELDVVVDTVLAQSGTTVDKAIRNKVKSKLKKAYKTLENSTISKSDYKTTVERLAFKLVEQEVGNLASSKQVQKDITAEVDKEVKRNIQHSQTGDTVLPEDLFDDMVGITDAQKNLNEEADNVNNEMEQSASTNPEQAPTIREKATGLIKSINKKIQRLGVSDLANTLQRFAAKAVADKDNKFGPTIKENFDHFVKYLESILSPDTINRNWNLIKNIFKGWNRNAQLAKSYRAYKQEGTYGDWDLNNTDARIDVERNNYFESKKSKEQEKRIIFNRKPAITVAHLSATYYEARTAAGDVAIRQDINPVFDISPIVDPNSYNGGESVEFVIDRDYAGEVKLIDEGGIKRSLPWSQVKKAIFSDDGQIHPNAEKRLKKLASGVDISIYGVIPIKILGKDGESLGYVHESAWITRRTSDPTDIETSRQEVLLNREGIISTIMAGNQAKGKIDRKVIGINPKTRMYSGFAMNHIRDKGSALDNIPDSFTMGVVGLGTIRFNGAVQPNDILNYDDVLEYPGATVINIPVGKVNGKMQYHAEYLTRNNIPESIYKPSLQIIEAFLTQKPNDVSEMYKTNKINVMKIDGAKKALSAYLRIIEEVDQEGTATPLSSILSQGNGSTALITLRLTENGKPYLAHGITSEQTIFHEEGTNNLEEGLGALERYFTTGFLRFNTNMTHLKQARGSNVRSRGDKKVTVVINDTTGVPKVHKVNYADFTKGNTSTNLQHSKVNNDDTKNVYTLQNLVEFSVDQDTRISKPKPKVKVDKKFEKAIKEEAIEGSIATGKNKINASIRRVIKKAGLVGAFRINATGKTIATALNIKNSLADKISAMLKTKSPEKLEEVLKEITKNSDTIEDLSKFDTLSVAEQDNLNSLIAANPELTVEMIEEMIASFGDSWYSDLTSMYQGPTSFEYKTIVDRNCN